MIKKEKIIYMAGGLLLIIILGIIVLVFLNKSNKDEEIEESNKLFYYWYEQKREIYANDNYVDSLDNVDRNYIVINKEQIDFCNFNEDGSHTCEYGELAINDNVFSVETANENLKGTYLYKISENKLKLTKEEDNKKIIIYYSMFEG